MKIRGIHIGLGLIFLFLLCFPQAVRDGASAGLALWANTVIPVLFPFILASNLFTALGMASGKWYAVLLGYLCGYPMGAKAAGDLVRQKAVTKKQGQWLMCCCNLPSPMFLTGFIQIPAVTAAVYLPALVLLIPVFFFKKEQAAGAELSAARAAAGTGWTGTKLGETMPAAEKPAGAALNETAPPPQGIMPMLEQAMEVSVKLIIKIGIYIMIFSILSVGIQKIPFLPPFIRALLLGMNEMTLGISTAKQMNFPMRQQAILCAVFSTFGGLSGLSQTRSVTEEAGFSMGFYVLVRLLHVAMAVGILGVWRF